MKISIRVNGNEWATLKYESFLYLQIVSDDSIMKQLWRSVEKNEMSDQKPSHRQFHQLPTCGYVDRRDKLIIMLGVRMVELCERKCNNIP